jgi:hypothetical protein
MRKRDFITRGNEQSALAIDDLLQAAHSRSYYGYAARERL